MTVDLESAPVVGPGVGRRPTLLVGVAATIAVALVVGGLTAWAWHWRTHPTLLPEVANSVDMKMSPTQRPTMYFGVTYPEGERRTITIEAVSPRLFANTAGAGFVFYVCKPDDALFGVANPGDFERLCPNPVPVVKDTTFDLGEAERSQLVMGVTVRQPGSVEMDGVDITYTAGHQRGTQATGLEVGIESR